MVSRRSEAPRAKSVQGDSFGHEQVVEVLSAHVGSVRRPNAHQRHTGQLKQPVLEFIPLLSIVDIEMQGIHLYVILDIFSRYVVGWLIAPRESAQLAQKLIAETVAKQNIAPGTLTLHADRGTSMRSKTVAELLVDLEVTKSHSRPYVSDDNPFSEAHFKTLKYRPDFPQRFGCIADARAHCQAFFPWYNDRHRHSGIGYMTPAAMHYGQAQTLFNQRAQTLDAAFIANPKRFKGNCPQPPSLPVAAWINPPKKEPISTENKSIAH